MAGAGYDPEGMPAFLRLVLREQQLNPANVPPYFLSHPLTEERIAELEHRVHDLPRPKPRPEAAAELAAAQATLRTLTESRDVVLPAYEEPVARAPDDARARHLLGLVYLYGGQPDRAEPLLARAAAAGVPRARGDHGRALVRLGKEAEARAELQAHLQAYP